MFLRRLKKIFVILIVLLVCAGGWLIFSSSKLAWRFSDTHAYHSKFDFDIQQPFSRYVEHVRSRIRAAKLEACQRYQDCSAGVDEVVEGNAPFELPVLESCPNSSSDKASKGVLLVHGAKTSAYEMHALGKFFQENCFLVKAITLPGHGTIPGDTANVTFSDWQQAVAFGVGALAREVDGDNIYLVGQSTGGLLATLHQDKDPRVKALVLVTPAFKLRSPIAFTLPTLQFLARLSPAFAWWNRQPDKAWYRYESTAINIPAEVRKGTKQLSALRVTKPVFTVSTSDDGTVSSDAIFSFFLSMQSNESDRLMVFYPDKISVYTRKEQLVKESLLELLEPRKLNLFGFSHSALHIPNDDTYFGNNGTYRYCLHYELDSSERSECENLSVPVARGEPKSQFAKDVGAGKVIARQTSNDWFYSAVLPQLSLFIDQVESQR